jgi:pyruvate/2-oxoglutarate dehydrogenase complex dihydrolipoamide dehydrogenase (E3) component
VALVEAALWGPRASNWTCVPSSLVRSGDVSPRPTATGRELGLTGHIDVQAALAQRDYVTSKWHDEGQLPWLKEHKITLVSGSGRLDGRQRSRALRRGVIGGRGGRSAGNRDQRGAAADRRSCRAQAVNQP